MDVQLPDGTVVKNVPEGTTRSQLMARVQKMSPEAFKEIKDEGNVVRPPQMMTPSGEKPELSYSNPDLLRGHPLVRFAEGAASPILGAGQLTANLVGAGGPVNRFLRSSDEQAQEARAQLGSEGADFWKLGGTVVSPAVLAAMKVPVAGTVLGRAGQGAAVGAAMGAASPVTDESDYWMRKGAQVGTGAVIGGVIPPAIDVVRAVGRIGRNIIDPILPGGAERGAARIMAEAAGPKRAAIEAELAKNQMLVQGSQPTAAEAAAGAGSPEFAALQKIAAAHRPSAYSDIAKAQEAARLAAVRKVGQTPEQLKAAESIRSISGQRNYGAVVDDMINSDGRLKSLLSRPSMDKALGRARELAAEEEKAFMVGKDTATQAVPSRILNERGSPAFIENIPGTSAKYPVRSLQHIKMAMDDMVKNPERFGIGASEVNAIQKTRGEFVNWLSKESPKWERARLVYAQQSRPINEMQVGQELEKALTKPVGEGERAGAFGTAMREAPRTMKKATGQPRFEELGDVLKPENLASVKSVLADLSRKAEFDRLAPLGREKAAQAAQPFGLPATGPLHQSYMIFKTVLGRVSKGINEKTLDTMADALQVPSATLKVLQKVPTEKQAAMIDSIISAKLGRGAIAAGSSLSGEGINNAR